MIIKKLLILGIWIIPLFSVAQPPPPDECDPEVEICDDPVESPLDEGVALLLAVGGIVGLKKLRRE